MPGKLLPNKDGMSKVAIQEIADRIEMARPRVLEELSWICKSREGKLTSTQVRAVADVISHLVPVTDVATVLCEWLMQNGGDPGAAWEWKESPQGRACIEAAAISDGPRRDLPAGRLRDLFLIKDTEAEAMELRQLVSERIRSRLRRRAEGAKPRKAVAQIEQPWVAEGISRATWFRKRSAEREIETPSDPIERARKADLRDDSAYNTIGLLGVSPELSPLVTRLPTAEGRRYASLALRCGLTWSDGYQGSDKPHTWFAPTDPITKAEVDEALASAIIAQQRAEWISIARSKRQPRIPPRPLEAWSPDICPRQVTPSVWDAVPKHLRRAVLTHAGFQLLCGFDGDAAVGIGVVAAERELSRIQAISSAYPDAPTIDVQSAARALWKWPLDVAVKRAGQWFSEAAAAGPDHGERDRQLLARAERIAALADPPFPASYAKLSMLALVKLLADPSSKHMAPWELISNARDTGYNALFASLKSKQHDRNGN